LLDFNELTPAAPVATFMQELNEKKTLSVDQLAIALPNLSCYMSCLPYEQVTIFGLKGQECKGIAYLQP
jgi:hypothetical protein